MRRPILVAVAVIGGVGLASACLVAWREERSVRSELAAHEAERAQSQAAVDGRERALRAAAATEDAQRVRLLALGTASTGEQDAAHAVAEALKAEGLAPSDYFASFREEGRTLVFALRHEQHPTDFHEKGDACGKCRTAVFERDRPTVRLFGVR